MMTTLYLCPSHDAAEWPVDHLAVELAREFLHEDTPVPTHFTTIHSFMPEAVPAQVATIIDLIRVRVNLCDYDTAANLALPIFVMEEGWALMVIDEAKDGLSIRLIFKLATQTWYYLQQQGDECSRSPGPDFTSLDAALGHLADRDPQVNDYLMGRRIRPRRF